MTTPTIHIPGKVRSGQYSGASTPLDFGDVAAEFHAFTSGCAVYDLSWRAKLALTGEDRVRWLNGMVTNNVRDLLPGHGVYAFVLNPQGHILGDIYAFYIGETVLVDTDRSQLEKILATFDHYIIMDDVEVRELDSSLTALGISGPRAGGVLASAGIAAPELAPLQRMDLQWNGIGLSLLRADEMLPDSWQIWLGPEHTADVWQALATAGATPSGADAYELYRIARGIPRYGIDIRERDLPQETNQARALNFTKGCYVGQEIVERIRSRGKVHRLFTGFRVEGPSPAPGTKIQIDGKDVGEITSAAVLPHAAGGQSVALGYIRREAAVGKPLQAGETHLTVAAVPFANLD